MRHNRIGRVVLPVLMALGGIVGLVAALLAPGMWGSRVSTAHAQGSGTVRYVAITGNDASNDCTNAGNPCRTIQHAVDVAQPGDEIRVAAGTYTDLSARPAPPGYGGVAPGGVITQVVYITKSVTIRGGYSPGQWNTSDPQANPTVLNAQQKGRGMVIAGEITPTVEGLQIVAGRAISAGGGIYVLSATATLQDNVIYNNAAISGTGGGIFMSAADQSILVNNEVYSNVAELGGGLAASGGLTVTIQGNKIYDNRAGTNGGGVSLGAGGSYYFRNNHVYGNQATNGNGGGVNIAAVGTFVSTTNNLVHDNVAGTAGGGIDVLAVYGVAQFSGDSIYANKAITGGGLHAAMILGVANLVDVRLHDNRAQQGGGGAYLSGGFSASALTGTHVYSNSAGWDGGGIFFNFGGTVDLYGNYVYGNQAGRDGGGIFSSLGLADLNSTNDVVAGNQAGRFGSGMALNADGSSDIRVKHATIARNTGGDGSGIHVAMTSTVQVSNTIIVSHTVGITVAPNSKATLQNTLWATGTAWANLTDWAGKGTINTIANYGGDPKFVAPERYDYHIKAGSAAIDQGTNAGVTTDIDAQTRDASPDLGADEYPASCTPPTSVTITGPVTTTVKSAAAFTATVDPSNTSPALGYMWQATEQSSVTHPNSTSPKDTVLFTWNVTGTKMITVTTWNACGTVQATRTITVEAAATANPPGSVTLSGPMTATVGTPTTFTATVPTTSTTPITYTWQATGQSSVVHTGGVNDTVVFTWTTAGTKTITVTAANAAGSATATRTVTVMGRIYLPLVRR